MTETLRIDKWLWFARFFKSRSLAATMVESGEVWLNDRRVAKPAQTVKLGDQLQFPTGKHLRRITILALSDRRGPAPEAQALYRDTDPPSA